MRHFDCELDRFRSARAADTSSADPGTADETVSVKVLAAYTAWKEWQEQVLELWELGSINRRVDKWEKDDSLNS